MKDILVARGFTVFIVNGDGLRLTNTTLNIIEEKNEELKIQIIQMCLKYRVRDTHPIALTGNICIGRGISIMSPAGKLIRGGNGGDRRGLFLDYGIISAVGKESDISQSAGRLKGNIKGWSEYRQPVVFVASDADKIVRKWEQKSRALARIAYESPDRGTEHATISIKQFAGSTKNELNEERDKREFDYTGKNGGAKYLEFASINEINDYRKKLRQGTQQTCNRISLPSSRDEDGFVKSNTSKHEVLRRANLDTLWNDGQSVCAAMPKGAKAFEKEKSGKIMDRVFWFYENNETNPGNVLCAIRWIKRL